MERHTSHVVEFGNVDRNFSQTGNKVKTTQFQMFRDTTMGHQIDRSASKNRRSFIMPDVIQNWAVYL